MKIIFLHLLFYNSFCLFILWNRYTKKNFYKCTKKKEILYKKQYKRENKKKINCLKKKENKLPQKKKRKINKSHFFDKK
jgi:hypothetical protein